MNPFPQPASGHRGKVVALTAAFLVAVLTLAGCDDTPRHDASAHLQADPFPHLDRYVQGAMAQWRVPGLAIAVVRGDATLFARGYGVRRVGTRDSVDTATIFGLLSPTKTVTTTALAVLVEEGTLAWDDPVIRHLPDVRLQDSMRTRRLTVRDLVSHRSGYADPVQLWYDSDRSPEEIINRLDTLEPDAPLRDEYRYNNVMYAVAGAVMEAASGRRWKTSFSRGFSRTWRTFRIGRWPWPTPRTA